jgi:hypothetical protein
MRKTILVACVAAIGGFCLATATSLAAARYNMWKSGGNGFQIGYVVGYIDAVGLSQRHDERASIPTRGGKNYDRWIKGVNAFYEKPENRNREIADAIYSVGQTMRDEYLRQWGKGLGGLKPLTTPVPTPKS